MSNKKSIFRMDIWEANFDNNYDSVINGKHACIIFSGWKQNIRRGGNVSVIPLTSNLIQYLDVQINLNGYNLKEESKALCNQITCIPKVNLLFKIGSITDVAMQIKLENAVSTQLELTRTNFNALDLENLFVSSSKVENKKVELEKLKTQVLTAYRNKKYNETIILSEKLQDLATSLKYLDKSQNFIWYATYMNSLSNLYLNNLELAKEKAQECFSYINPSEMSSNYSLSLFLTANIAEDMKETQNAILIYQALVKHFKNGYENIMRISTLYNVALLKNNHKRMLNIYHILETVVVTNRSIYNTESYKNEVLLQIKEELITLGLL